MRVLRIGLTCLVIFFHSLTLSLSFAPSKNAKSLQYRPSGALLTGLKRSTSKTTTASSSTGSFSLSMHMGHSHAHHDHSHAKVQQQPSNPVTALAQKVTPRRAAIFLFVAVAILGPPLLRRRALERADVAAFFFTSTLLAVSEKIRDQIQAAIRTISNFRNGIAKHSSPVSPGKVLKYIFRNDNAADRVTLIGGLMNLALSLGKFAVGITCHSSALIADAGHSLSDLFSDFITLWAVQIGRLPPDDDHPYGHAKFEAIGSLFLALTLLGTGVSVGAVSNKKLIEILSAGRNTMAASGAAHHHHILPTAPALLMAAMSIFSKEWLFRITRQVGEKINSQVVIANAWHHRSDAYSSVLALLAIALAMYFPGLIAADAAAGILVAGMICMTGAEIMGESIKQLTDTSNEDLLQAVHQVAHTHADDNDFSVQRIRARQVGSSAMVDVSIETPGDLPASESHRMAQDLKERIMQDVQVLDAEVHAIAATTTPMTTMNTTLSTTTNTNTNAAVKSSDTTTSTTSTTATSTALPQTMQDQIRQEVTMHHPQVVSVQSVRYSSTTFGTTAGSSAAASSTTTRKPSIDVVIRVDPDATVSVAHSVAEELRQALLLQKNYQASIFLDLNHQQATVSSAVE